MNYQPDELPFIKTAKKYQFGGYQRNLIKVKGEDPEKCVVKDFRTIKGKKSSELLHNRLGQLAERFIIKKPVIKKSLCIGCGECVKVCPAKIITLVNKNTVISYINCIKCYCCFEIYSENSVKLKIKPLL